MQFKFQVKELKDKRKPQMDKDNETENQLTHERVHTFLIDLKYLIKNYKNDNQKTLDTIVKEITKLP